MVNLRLRWRNQNHREPEKRVLIVCGAGWGNVGDDLILRTLVDSVGTNDVRLTVAGGPKRLSWLPRKSRQLLLSGIRGRIAMVREIMLANEVYIGGGGLFEDRTLNFYRPFTRAALVAFILRVPYHIVAVGVGPLRRSRTARAYRRTFDRATTSSVRDPESANVIRSTGASRVPSVVPDPVLSRPYLHSISSLPKNKIVINLRNWEWGDLTELPPNIRTDDIVRIVADGINPIVSHATNIALVSMCSNEGDDDSVALDSLARIISGRVSKIYSGEPQMIEEIVAGADVIVSMRLHLLLLGVKQRTPVIGLAYDPKVHQQARAHGFKAFSIDSLTAGILAAEISAMTSLE